MTIGIEPPPRPNEFLKELPPDGAESHYVRVMDRWFRLLRDKISSINTTISSSTLRIINVRDAPYNAVGDGVTDDAAAIQAAIDYANSIATSSQIRSVVDVWIPEGDYYIGSQLVVKPHVNIFCEGVIYNNLANTYDYAMWFKAGSHCAKLNLWGNLKNGVQFGEYGVYSDMQIGDVRMLNIGETYVSEDSTPGASDQFHRGCLFTGYNFTVDSLDIDGGNIGCDIETASDVRIDKALLYTASTGLRITSACEHIYIGYLDIDTPAYLGIQVDSSNDVYIASATVFVNDSVGTGALTSGYAIKIGEFSGTNKVNAFYLQANVINTGGTALFLDYVKHSRIDIAVTNDANALFTGGATPVATGIEYGTNLGEDVHVTGTLDVATPIDSANPPMGTYSLNFVEAGAKRLNEWPPHSQVNHARLAAAENLKGSKASVKTVTFTADKILLVNSDDRPVTMSSISVTPDVSATGANGRVSGEGAETSSTWYFVWVIYDGSTIAGLLSKSATAPTLPTGYTYKGLVGAVYNNSGSDFDDFIQRGDRVAISENVALTNGTASSWTSISLSAVIPSIAKEVYGSLQLNRTSGTANVQANVSPEGSQVGISRIAADGATGATTDENRSNFVCLITTAQTMYYIVPTTNTELDVAIAGYRY